MAALLEVSHLKKTFYSTPSFSQLMRGKGQKNASRILTDVCLTLEQGELYCLIGPNGAGKTTLLKILCGLILPDEGTFRLSGEVLSPDTPRLKSTFGLVSGEERSFYWRLTGRQNLEFFSAFYPMSCAEAKCRINELSTLFHMGDYLDKYFFTYSSGMKQCLGLCRCLLGNPKILFLDEPTRSLDPEVAFEWRHFIRETLLKKEGKTVLYTTHQLEEAELFSDRIGILSGGRVMAEGNSFSLKRAFGVEENASLLGVLHQITKGKLHAS